MGIFPKVRGEHKNKYLKPPPRKIILKNKLRYVYHAENSALFLKIC